MFSPLHMCLYRHGSVCVPDSLHTWHQYPSVVSSTASNSVDDPGDDWFNQENWIFAKSGVKTTKFKLCLNVALPAMLNALLTGAPRKYFSIFALLGSLARGLTPPISGRKRPRIPVWVRVKGWSRHKLLFHWRSKGIVVNIYPSCLAAQHIPDYTPIRNTFLRFITLSGPNEHYLSF